MVDECNDPTALSVGAVKEIESLTKQALGRTVTIAGLEYATVPLHDPRRPEREPDPVGVATLQSFVEFVKGGEDAAYRDGRGLFVHVASPTDVLLCTGIFGEFHQRVTLAVAQAIVPSISFGMFKDPESFIVELLACFEPLDDRADVFRLVGNLKTEAVQTLADDGVSQEATARKGIVKVENVSVPNPVRLRPYRTFAEVDQVASPFVLRLRGGGEGRLPMCALFECDGGRWRLDAIQNVKEWLEGELPSDVPVYG